MRDGAQILNYLKIQETMRCDGRKQLGLDTGPVDDYKELNAFACDDNIHVVGNTLLRVRRLLRIIVAKCVT